MDEKTSGNKEKLYLGGDYYTASAVYVKEGSGNWNIYYICRDYLGSITHVTNSSGSVVQELSYDAWGRLRNPATQAAYNPGSEPALFLDRGYTGHEHLTRFGLVNMNARLYDPAVGRFLSPDPYVQDPTLSQSYNRYAYCINNPLLYVDLYGYSWFSDLGHKLGSSGRFITSTLVTIGVTVGVGAICVATGGLGAVAIVAIAGASGGLAGSTLGTAFDGGSGKDYLVNGLIGAGVGAVSGMAGYGAGNLGAKALQKGLISLSASGTTITSPVAQGVLVGMAGGALGGGAAGFAGGFISTAISTKGDWSAALKAGLGGTGKGALMGGGIGAATGAYGGYKYTKAHNLDPWSGKSLGESTSQHAVQRMWERNVSMDGINDAMKNPLKIGDVKFDSQGRPSVTYIGTETTVVVNPETGTIITVYPTSTQRLNNILKINK
ncbi:hypothetical protein FACS1894123_01250 [Bacteroidia bacterium]|nr:hypothetical protein FACS1894123_01250 [Bacteroidia bacterium]